MSANIPGRLTELRKSMQQHAFDAYIVLGTDPHQSEYLADHWQTRSWISGFHGSAGTVVVTAGSAGLWTDSRYYLEATTALEGSGIDLHRVGTPSVIDYPQWLANRLTAGQRVGVDAQLIPVGLFRTLRETLRQSGAEVVAGADLIGPIWTDRPALPHGTAFLLEDRYSGNPRSQKLAELRRTIEVQGITHYLIATLDDLAWLLNVRASDIPYNPLLMAYALITHDSVLLCTEQGKFSTEDRRLLTLDGVTFQPYAAIGSLLRTLPAGSTVAIDPARTSMELFDAIPLACTRVEQPHVTSAWKAIKNRTEQENIRRCMVRDGVALERLFHWLETTVGAGDARPDASSVEPVTELTVVRKLHELRAEGANFVGESFRTIAGFADHGAIIHYTVTPQTDRTLRPNNLLLLDCGAHYLDGTTDITRVVAIGKPSAQQRLDFTLVLKAHIALASSFFPERTTGVQLDAIARSVLWRELRNYGHGTGHGVGYFLNVHEGPQKIAQEKSEAALLPGMLTSNEPGVYRAGQYGIRIENLVLAQPDRSNEFATFLRFETVSLCHIELGLVEPRYLSPNELEWLNDYNARVYRELAPHLEAPVAAWLAQKTAALTTPDRRC